MTVPVNFHFNSHSELDFGPMRIVCDAQKTVRRRNYELASWYFSRMAESAMPDEMHPGDLGELPFHKMTEADL